MILMVITRFLILHLLQNLDLVGLVLIQVTF